MAPLGDAGRQVAQVAQAEQLVFDIRDRRDTTGPRALTECVRDALEQIDRRAGGELAGLATGYADLDTVLAGLRPGQLVVIGARPGGGKTAIGLNVAVNIAVAATYGGMFAALAGPGMSDVLVCCMRDLTRAGFDDSHCESVLNRLEATFPEAVAKCSVRQDNWQPSAIANQ